MRRAGSAISIHFVWATWDRQPLLQAELGRRVYRAIADQCAELSAQVIALGGIEDHVHLLVRLPASLSVADLVKTVKGSSSHLSTHEVLGHNHFFKWQRGYGAVSVSPRHVPKVSDCIARQREHHAAGTLVATLEDAGGPWTNDTPADITTSADDAGKSGK